MAIAKIIVDVPLMQTDQPYSYRIPEEFMGMLEVGMRVHVPFGKGNRLIQGIVLGLETQSDEEEANQDLKILLRYWIFLLYSRKNNSGWLRSSASPSSPTKSPSLRLCYQDF